MPILELYDTRRRVPIVHEKSGLNWGLSPAHVSPCDAYIVYRKDFARQNPGFFPPHGAVFIAVWDDGTRMVMRMEGSTDLDGEKIPKQISTDGDKSILGEYIRRRLNVSDTHLITYQDLLNYGRDNIEVTKNEDGSYLFDFSVNG